MTLRVIGTGFGRTGTESMREALGILGFGPCHHMRELIEDAEHARQWKAVTAGATPDWNLLLGNYQSCVDWPSAHYWSQLINVFPKASVILTWRTAESWWASFEKTLLPIILAHAESHASPKNEQLISTHVFQGKPLNREHCMAVYEMNVAAVKKQVPAERLLIHSLGDGWEPLCAHLDVPVPDTPYPSRNSTSKFQEEFLDS